MKEDEFYPLFIMHTLLDNGTNKPVYTISEHWQYRKQCKRKSKCSPSVSMSWIKIPSPEQQPPNHKEDDHEWNDDHLIPSQPG